MDQMDGKREKNRWVWEDGDFSKYEELQLLVRDGALDDLYLDILSPPFQTLGGEIGILSNLNSQLIQPSQDQSYPFPSASLEILRHRISAVNGRKTKIEPAPPSMLSTNHIIQLSAANFIQANSGIITPCASTFPALATDHAEDIQLVQDLLSCAEKVNNQQYDSARKLLEECNNLRFGQMNTIQRLVYYFTDALRDKIERERGMSAGKHEWPLESTNVSSAAAAFHQKSPLNQATRFASIQTLADHVEDSRRVHIVDLGIKCGVRQMIIMQALAARSDQFPLEHLKITAIATKPNLVTNEAGVRLAKLATSFNLSFSFHVIQLQEIEDLEKSPLGLDLDETVVVHAAYALECMIANPNQLDSLMRVVRSINPSVMIVSEIEANVNSPVFVNRFVEALFFYGAYFDCLGDCLKDNVAERTFIESNLFGPVIRNTVAAEGEERLFRTVGVNVWREFFARFGMVETEVSKLALDHATLVIDKFECRDSCTLGLNGKCLIACWKGTPICSLSAWKFKEM